MRHPSEIRKYFCNLLNHALPRLGMYGDELSAIQFLKHLAFIDSREDELRMYFDALTKRGVACSATGVAGGFRKMTGQATDNEIASVYAEIAFQMGYLDVTRLLSKLEFDTLKLGLRRYCRAHDLTTNDVKGDFGEPSWIAGTNPVSSCVYLYLTAEPEFSSVAFDFWNEINSDREMSVVRGTFGDVPVLRDVRIRGNHFAREFTFTPLGRKITGRR